jgi:hypothetical protein
LEGLQTPLFGSHPKGVQPLQLSRFRPISLCNSTYKVLTKIIAKNKTSSRQANLRKPRGIHGKQANYRQHHLVQEAIYVSQRNKERGMVIKLDMENAFDKFKHAFLFSVMRKFGFSKNFVDWIQACIGSP